MVMVMVMVNVNLYGAIVTKSLMRRVTREKPGFQALSKGLVVLLCAQVVRQVLDPGALHSESSAANSG